MYDAANNKPYIDLRAKFSTFLSDRNHIGKFTTGFNKSQNIIFHEKPPNGSRADTCG